MVPAAHREPKKRKRSFIGDPSRLDSSSAPSLYPKTRQGSVVARFYVETEAGRPSQRTPPPEPAMRGAKNASTAWTSESAVRARQSADIRCTRSSLVDM